ncbi:hypothetical protein LL252_04735 [Alcanivorax marinus]|uniref:Uncharacterized protein n=1 Tax=Alloalcanivorax marinus TaxID=1177169 RepID=A0A9Q3UKU4_9GAMM|nr:hypothetical protein [Alloalcanivorax marinus]MCC4307871.1 hypothetical protein [Alloalcanivorax marinus]
MAPFYTTHNLVSIFILRIIFRPAAQARLQNIHKPLFFIAIKGSIRLSQSTHHESEKALTSHNPIHGVVNTLPSVRQETNRNALTPDEAATAAAFCYSFRGERVDWVF